MEKMMMSKVKHLKGNKLEGYTALVRCAGKSVSVVFDCGKKRLMIDRWYRLTEDERSAVSAFASAHFLGLMSGEAIA